jgi:hypothetical protein
MHYLAILLIILSSCVFDASKETESQVMSKQKQYIDTIKVKDIAIDTIIHIDSVKVNDSVFVYDTLKIVKTTYATDTIKTVVNNSTIKYDTLTHTLYDTSYKSIKYDTIHTKVFVYDTLNHSVISFDTTHITISDTMVRYDTIFGYTESKGVAYDSARSVYFGFHSVGTIKVTNTTFTPDQSSGIDTLYTFAALPQYQSGGVGVYNAYIKIGDTNIIRRGDINESDKYITRYKNNDNPCPNGWRLPTQRDISYIQAYNDTSWLMNSYRYTQYISINPKDTVIISTPNNYVARNISISYYNMTTSNNINSYNVIVGDTIVRYPSNTKQYIGTAIINSICIQGNIKGY